MVVVPGGRSGKKRSLPRSDHAGERDCREGCSVKRAFVPSMLRIAAADVRASPSLMLALDRGMKSLRDHDVLLAPHGLGQHGGIGSGFTPLMRWTFVPWRPCEAA